MELPAGARGRSPLWTMVMAAAIFAGCTDAEWDDAVATLSADMTAQLQALERDVRTARMLQDNGTRNESFPETLDAHVEAFLALESRARELVDAQPKREGTLGSYFGVMKMGTAANFFAEGAALYKTCWMAADADACEKAPKRIASGKDLLREAAEAFRRPDCTYVPESAWDETCS